MRDYTYLEGGRFLISNIYRSKRFDIDRLDLNWVDEEKPDFVRGFRIVDHDENLTITVHGEDADNLIFSMSFISSKSKNTTFEDYDRYLIECLESKNYMVTEHDVKPKQEKIEEVLH